MFDIVASNIRGLGAVQLAQSLLPAFERVASNRIGTVWLPQDGQLRDFRGILTDDHYASVNRVLPNALSRIGECFFPSRIYPPERPLIVLGDLPLRHSEVQVLFTHRAHLIRGVPAGSFGAWLTSVLSQRIFAINIGYVNSLVVQTAFMRNGLQRTYHGIDQKTHIVAQPAPEWLLIDPIKRSGRVGGSSPSVLKLFYPSAVYPHKNHDLLFRYRSEASIMKYAVEITVTCERPAAFVDEGHINFAGRLDPRAMRGFYSSTDALIFPSMVESYGLPLVEAILIGLPIICADRPYARQLCGDGAVYFDPISTTSLGSAIEEMRHKLDAGWWPDWSVQRSRFPTSWDDVARAMIKLLDN